MAFPVSPIDGELYANGLGVIYKYVASDDKWIINSQTIQGYTGLQGYTGGQGDTGLQGITGLIGDTGLQGAQGNQGETGAQGSTGLQGDQGNQGETGAQGLQGIQGNQGLTGLQGAQGETGAQGFTGLQGAQGETGLQGFTGAQGYTGVNGLQGFTGIQGETGVRGETGPAGAPQGETGSQGVTGLQGIQGATGSQGVTGLAMDTAVITAYFWDFVSDEEGWDQVTNNMTVVWNGAGTSSIRCTAVGADPWHKKTTTGSLAGNMYPVIKARYKVVDATNVSTMLFVWTFDTDQEDYVEVALNTDGNWHVFTIDMFALGDTNWLNKSILSIRFDWATASGGIVDVDYMTIGAWVRRLDL